MDFNRIAVGVSKPGHFDKQTGWAGLSRVFCVVKTEGGKYLIKRVNQQADQLILQLEAPGHPPTLIPLNKFAE